MTILGLSPADIDTTAEAIAAAKKHWNVSRMRELMRRMSESDQTIYPVYFNRTMAGLGLRAEHLGVTDAELAHAKRRWRWTP
jgi:hypothetical protein